MNARKGNAHPLRTVTLNIRSIGVNTVNWVCGGGGVYPLKKNCWLSFLHPRSQQGRTYVPGSQYIYINSEYYIIVLMCSVLYLLQSRGCDISPGIVYMRSHSTNLNIAGQKVEPQGHAQLIRKEGVTYVGHALTACSCETEHNTWIYMYTTL